MKDKVFNVTVDLLQLASYYEVTTAQAITVWDGLTIQADLHITINNKLQFYNQVQTN